MAEERAVALGVCLARLVVVAHGLVAQEEREHRADALDAPERLRGRRSSRAPQPLELVVDARVAQAPEHRQAGRGRERIAGERPRLVDVAGRREPAHDLGTPAERGERQPAADDLAQDGQIGADAEPLLRAAAADPEAGDDLVEDEQRAGGVAERAQRLQEARLGRDDAHVPRDRLDEDRRETLAVALDRRGRGRSTSLYGRDDRVRRDAGRDAGLRRDAERGDARARVGEQRVDVAVVAAGEAEDRGRGSCSARASRIALIDASVPEETSRTCSTDGTASTISAASSTSASVGAPKVVPRCGGLDDRRRASPGRRGRRSAAPRT